MTLLTDRNHPVPLPILNPLGAGGMGDGTGARAPDRDVAVKVLQRACSPIPPRGSTRREARVFARLIQASRRSTTSIPGQPDFLVMEYVPGGTI
jgi:hypothetical protein